MAPAPPLHIPPDWEWPSKPRCLHETYGGRIAAHGSVQLKMCEPPVRLTMFSAWAGPASQSLPFIIRALGRPGDPPRTLIDWGFHFYRRSPASLAPSPSLLMANPSFLLATPGRANPGNCEPPGPPVQLLCVKWPTLIAHCHMMSTNEALVHSHEVHISNVVHQKEELGLCSGRLCN